MKFTVFGASGGTGLQLIDQAINKGHTVKAFVRAADRIPFTREGLTVVEGNVSGLDWTIVQPPRLTNEPGKGRYRHGDFAPSMLAKISRADVANFMIDSVEHDRYIKQSPFIHD